MYADIAIIQGIVEVCVCNIGGIYAVKYKIKIRQISKIDHIYGAHAVVCPSQLGRREVL